MLGMKITNFHYQDVVFPKQTVFVEFPKFVHMSGYPSTIAQNAEEEAVLLARPMEVGSVVTKPEVAAPKPAEPVATPVAILSGPNDEREILLQVAKEKNIKIDLRWKTDRIRATIERETAALNG